MKKKITIGSRGSKLALLYAKKVKEKIIEVTNFIDQDINIEKISTKGDEILDTRLSDVGGKGLFSSSIEQELQKNNIDIAVHALKDMPAIETNGLLTDTFLERTDAREIAIINGNKKFKDLKKCSKTSWPPKYENTEAKVQDPINNHMIIAVVFAVRKTDSLKFFHLSVL